MAGVEPDPVRAMDRMYRYTRHVYDASRKYYLFGRDQLIEAVELRPGERVLEVGCGTARNLIKLHRRFPDNALYGVDAANVMIETAQGAVGKAGAAGMITLKQGLAEQLDYRRSFGLDRPFDLILFSYSLSMIPPWRESLDNALANLKPGGEIWIVDFWDQADLPAWFARMLKGWLAAFHVHYRPELHDRLYELEREGKVTLTLRPIGRRYAYLAKLVRI